MSDFAWTAAAELAAELVAAGDLTQSDIAGRAGIDRATLYRWRKTPGFAARVDEYLAEYREGVRSRGLASRDKRIAALQRRWEALNRVIEERANDPVMASVPGGTTGLILHRVRRAGKDQTIETWEIDSALLRELREVEKQAAIELGQWTEKQETSGGMTIRVEYEPLAPAAGEAR